MNTFARCQILCRGRLRLELAWLLTMLWLTPWVGAGEFNGAQDADYVIVDWQVQDGLPSARIQDVVQTRDGYIWLATLDGLARFDGVRFERFYESYTPGLASSMISCLLEDRRGRLWYGTQSGEIGWHGTDGFHKLPRASGTALDPVVRLVETADGTLWAASRHGLVPIREELSGPPVIGPQNHEIWEVCQAEQGGLWVLVDGGNLYLLDVNQNTLTLAIPGQSGQWRNIAPARAGGLWVRDGQCVRRWQGEAWAEDRGVLDLQVAENVTMRESPAGTLLIGTLGQGLWLLAADGQQRHLDHGSGLSQDQILSLCEDREKNLWVGTVHGLNRLSRRVVRMITPPDNWQNRAISTVAPATTGNFWVGTEGAGLYLIDRAGQVLSRQLFDVWHQDIRCVLQDARGGLWAGVYNYGLWRQDAAHSQRNYLPNPTAGFANALFQDSRHAVWVGTTLGAARYAPGGSTLAAILLTNADVRCFAEGGDGVVWLGLQSGALFRHAPGTGPAGELPATLVRSSIHALHCATDGTLWIGTWRNGLAFLKNGHWGALTHEQGLPDDSISDIRSDADENLWIGSSRGLFRISRNQWEQYTRGEIKSVNCLELGSGDGLGTWEILGGSQPIACRTADGRLWYVTSVGLAVVDPQAIQPNPLPPPVVIESILADGKALMYAQTATDGPSATATARCPAGTRQLEIHYTALSLSAPRQVRFRYRLAGFDNRWIEAANERVACFSHLPHGWYTFEVTACNNHGVWNDQGARLAFQVLPLYWETVWFKLLVVMAAGLVGAFFYRVRQARLRALEHLRQQIARDLHDEVGSNLGSISLLAEVMEHRPQPGDLAQIRSTADQTVDTLRDLVWIINPSHEHLADLVARLRQIAATMLTHSPYEFVCREPAHSLKLSLKVRRNLPPLFKEVLNNIRKHAQASRVTIELACLDGKLILVVQDNGVGFVPNRKGPGDGLKNFQHRAAEMEGQLTLTSQPGAGTTIQLSVPLTNSRDWWQPVL